MDNWIDKDELPVRSDLRVVNINDPDYGMTQDEIDDRNEFIRCYILSGFEALLTIPQQKYEYDFFVEDWQESAFNTEDYYRLYPNRGYNKYSLKMKNVLQQVEHLAILYSCISHKQGRQRTFARYKKIVESEFRNKALFLVSRYKGTNDSKRRLELKEKISEINKRILQCKKIWEQHAPRDTRVIV